MTCLSLELSCIMLNQSPTDELGVFRIICFSLHSCGHSNVSYTYSAFYCAARRPTRDRPNVESCLL